MPHNSIKQIQFSWHRKQHLFTILKCKMLSCFYYTDIFSLVCMLLMSTSICTYVEHNMSNMYVYMYMMWYGSIIMYIPFIFWCVLECQYWKCKFLAHMFGQSDETFWTGWLWVGWLSAWFFRGLSSIFWNLSSVFAKMSSISKI